MPREHRELAERVGRGERLVSYPFIVSIVILTSQRSMGGVRWVKSGDWPMAPLIRATVVTSLFGWWGIPFGPIFSGLSLFYLWRGGRDATKEVLINALGAQAALQIIKSSPNPNIPPAIWFARAIILIQLAFAIWLWGMVIVSTG
ncbi:MAG TPA: hypothetical protein VF258_00220 [Luteolibacter sp.]